MQEGQTIDRKINIVLITIAITLFIHLAVFFFLFFSKVKTGSSFENMTVEQNVEIEINQDYQLTQEQKTQENLQDQPIENIDKNVNDSREKSWEDFSRNSNNDELSQSVKDWDKEFRDEYRDQWDEKLTQPEKTQLSKTKNDAKETSQSDGKKTVYAGKTTGSWKLDNRTIKGDLRKPSYRCIGSGTVIVNIKVNYAGEVVDAKVKEGSGITEECLFRNALSFAKKNRFNRITSGSKMQSGTITYTYIPKK